MEDARGRRFLLERWKEDDSGLGDWLQVRERLDREGLFPWPFRGPYRVLGEVHLPQEELPGAGPGRGSTGEGEGEGPPGRGAFRPLGGDRRRRDES